MALGAKQRQVLRMILQQAVTMLIVGILAGFVGALALTRYLEGLLYGLTPQDPATFLAAAFIISVVALLASCIPALRTTSVDPAATLRHE